MSKNKKVALIGGAFLQEGEVRFFIEIKKNVIEKELRTSLLKNI
jgi:hypothetical protein